MSNRTPHKLDAALHARTHREPHVDSEEAVQYERQRVSRELEPVYPHESATQSSEGLHTSRTEASVRSRNASLRDSIVSQEHLQRQASDDSTQPDDSGANEDDGRSSIREPHWYDPFTKFWSRHVSITIDEGAHRDHLGNISRTHP